MKLLEADDCPIDDRIWIGDWAVAFESPEGNDPVRETDTLGDEADEAAGAVAPVATLALSSTLRNAPREALQLESSTVSVVVEGRTVVATGVGTGAAWATVSTGAKVCTAGRVVCALDASASAVPCLALFAGFVDGSSLEDAGDDEDAEAATEDRILAALRSAEVEATCGLEFACRCTPEEALRLVTPFSVPANDFSVAGVDGPFSGAVP